MTESYDRMLWLPLSMVAVAASFWTSLALGLLVTSCLLFWAADSWLLFTHRKPREGEGDETLEERLEVMRESNVPHGDESMFALSVSLGYQCAINDLERWVLGDPEMCERR